jgi:hypothetical protein
MKAASIAPYATGTPIAAQDGVTMFRKAVAGTILSVAGVASAQAGFVGIDNDQSGVGLNSLAAKTVNIADSNNFKAKLGYLGVTQYTHGVSLGTDVAGTIDFYYYGKEAGYRNVFTAAGSLGEVRSYDTQFQPNFQDHFAAPKAFGSISVQGGLLDLGFCTYTAAPAVSGGCLTNAQNDSRNVYSPQSMVFSLLGNTAWIFWDDSGAGPDDNHDDAIIKAVFRPAAVPEPATLAIFGLGLVAVGATVARRARRS